MKIDIRAFKGRTPRKTDNLLTAIEATEAENCFMGKGDLRAWYEGSDNETLALSTAKTLYQYTNSNEGTTINLVDTDDVDYVESPIAEDIYERLYFTGKDEPRVICNEIDLTDTLGSELVFDGGSEAKVARFEETATSDATVSRDSGQAKTGTYSCKILRSAAGNDDFSYSFLDTDASRVRNSGDACAVACEIYLPSGQTLSSVTVQTTVDGSTWVDQDTVTATDAWTAVSFAFTPVSSFGVRFVGTAGDQNDYFYVDDISIKQYALKYYKLGIPQPDTTQMATSISVAGGGTAEDRIYAYTFVTAFGEESAPSQISDVVSGATDTDEVDISKIEAIPQDRQIETLRLYRTAAGSTDTAEFYWTTNDFTLPTIAGRWKSGSCVAHDGEYWFFDDGTDDLIYKCINDDTTADPDDATNGVGGSGTDHWEYYTITDDVTTATMLATGTVCPSQYYYPPPDDLTGLVRLPSGMLAGFAGNALYFSEPWLPHAWPNKSLALAHEIVGMAVHESVIVAATKLKPSLIIGDSPDTMYEVPLSGVFPCASKRGVCTGQAGVYYPSNEGVIRVNSESGAVNVSLPYLTENEWQEIIPANIHASVFSGKYFGFNSDTGTKFVIDFDSESYTTLSGTYHTSHVSPIDGKFYVIEEEVDTLYVREWEGDTTNLKQYAWASKSFSHSLVNWAVARVRIDPEFYADYLAALADESTLEELNEDMVSAMTMGGAMGDDPMAALPMAGTRLYSIDSLSMSSTVTFQLFVDGEKVFEKNIASNKPFKLPAGYKGRRTKIKVNGYLPVDAIEVATDMREVLNAAA
jgi:hypothetical protein